MKIKLTKNQNMNQFTVTQEFKARVSDILGTKKFSLVFPLMNLVNRDGFIYAEEELNQIVQFIGEFPYVEVAELFAIMPNLVKPLVPDAEAPVSREAVEETQAPADLSV